MALRTVVVELLESVGLLAEIFRDGRVATACSLAEVPPFLAPDAARLAA